jgi:serine/threonine protein kinase
MTSSDNQSPISHSPKRSREREKKSSTNNAPIKWKKGALIGSGSYGEVYLGMNQSNGELMAIKQVEFKDNGKADKFVQSLKQEIDILKDLHHKNIVQYYGSQSDEKYFDIFLEYVPGGSILSLLNNYGAFEELLIKNFIRQVLEGVNYLHEKGIVHRDIKGANILVDNKGIVKISDFGISKKVDENTVNMKSKMNNRTSFQGSIFWMAPEVIKQLNYTGKADIWSIGCLVIEMITAKHPWEQLDQTAAIFKIGSNNKPPMPKGLSEELNDFITRTFELDWNKRPSAKKLLTHKFIMDEDDANSIDDNNEDSS